MNNNNQIDLKVKAQLERDGYLKPFEPQLNLIHRTIADKEAEIISKYKTLNNFSRFHDHLGLHQTNMGWVFREWAPEATEIYLIGDFSNWNKKKQFRLISIGEGIWEIELPGDILSHLDLYRLRMCWRGGEGDRIPAYARRVVQDPVTQIFNAQVYCPNHSYKWKIKSFESTFKNGIFIYETHTGMAQIEGRVGTFNEFTDDVIPRIVKNGYNAIQMMAVQEHPYYGSFGYHVSNFFAVSSRFGTPDDFKRLVDTAHESGLAVIIDLVHSHSVSNEVEGLSRFDGSYDLYFEKGDGGWHELWDSRCFDYKKENVLRFLLSNVVYFIEEFRVDGFRFDGITSMLYSHHGLGMTFTSYNDYFNENLKIEALVYLALMNKLIHQLKKNALTLAEESSGIPELAIPINHGGYGFDYRYAMGIPDYWIKLLKEIPDENWDLSTLWFELTNRRWNEKTISYAESHDQALVGDKTIMFRLTGSDIYHKMEKSSCHLNVDRSIALHKMIRLITAGCAGNGYLNFMGNEFGHPEWIDFPRLENNWSYHYARRQWNLTDDLSLKYHYLADFDKDMIQLMREKKLYENPQVHLIYIHNSDQVIVFMRENYLFIFNFNPHRSFQDYMFDAPAGKYTMVLNTDSPAYGGFENITNDQVHFTFEEKKNKEKQLLSLYIPSRVGFVLKKDD